MPLDRELRRSFQGRRAPWNQGVRTNMARAGRSDADHCVLACMNLKSGTQIGHHSVKRPRCACTVGRRDGSYAARQGDAATGRETGTPAGKCKGS